jgi:hypothetical protein
MGYPPPPNSSEEPALTPSDPPGGTGTPIEPRLTEAEVLYTDRAWYPATVLGWSRDDVSGLGRVVVSSGQARSGRVSASASSAAVQLSQ